MQIEEFIKFIKSLDDVTLVAFRVEMESEMLERRREKLRRYRMGEDLVIGEMVEIKKVDDEERFQGKLLRCDDKGVIIEIETEKKEIHLLFKWDEIEYLRRFKEVDY